MIDDLTTVLITTSPRRAHPDTDLIENTLFSIRNHLQTAQILILCDGVRKEQESYRQRYSEFILALEAIILDRWANVRLVVEPEWLHQAWLIAKGIEQVKTPLILFTEEDQRLLNLPIPWDTLAQLITSNQVKLVRFMLEDRLPVEWKHLMLGPVEPYTELLKTVQWSQRTHLASVEYYRWQIERHLKPGDRCYFEDRMYGLEDSWEDHKLSIFYPPNPRRIYHSDGRGDDAKFESVLE
jgi:hypothetical protein